MGHYVAENSLQSVINLLFSPSRETDNGKNRIIKEHSNLDTLEALKDKSEKGPLLFASRPPLPPVQKSAAKETDFLALLAEAFSESFDAMGKSVQEVSVDFADLQKFSQSQSLNILTSTTDAMNKQKDALQLQEQVSEYQKAAANKEQTVNYVMLGVTLGLTLILVTITALPTGGASLAAAPEILDLEVGAGAIEMSEMSTEVVGQVAESSTAITASDASSASAATSGSAAAAESSQSAASSAEADAAASTSRSALAWAKWVGTKLIGAAIGGALGTPQLMNGLSQLNYIYPQLKKLAQLQTDVGTALAKLQENNSIAQFFQQLAQREGTMLQDTVSSASQVIDTYADILQSYRQIPYGLAQAV